MLGEFHVFYGNDDGTYQSPATLQNSEGKSLAIASDLVTDYICTRPYAVDLNGDGHLDIVAGSKTGKFYLFQANDSGQYSDSSVQLTDSSNQPLKLDGHSDPYFVDWDGDGDQDMLSGDHSGAVYFFENTGDKFAPAFAKPVTVVASAFKGDIPLYSDGITRPQGGTRVSVADMNQDGKLDILVGDVADIYTPKEGVSEAEARKQLSQLAADWAAVERKNREAAVSVREKIDTLSPLFKRRGEIVDGQATGFVWLYLQK